MEVHITNENFQSIYQIDRFKSLIWTERYCGYGDFELTLSMNHQSVEVINFIKSKMESNVDTYLWLKEADSYMIIEDLEIKTDNEEGNILIISGRGLESILERRIIWEQTSLNGDLQNGIEKLLNDSIISPKIADRKINNFIMVKNSNEAISKMKISAQYTGKELYETVKNICDTVKLGFDVTRNDDQNRMEFHLTIGEDRTYSQDKNPHVIFSPKFENLIGSDYLESGKTLKTVTLVAGEDKSQNRKTTVVGGGVGLSRKELYTDARDIQSEQDGTTISDSEYLKLLQQRGLEKLSEETYIEVFTGEVEAYVGFVYGKDFLKGDIVQIVNEYGMETEVRVIEMVRSQDETGFNMYPTFEVVKE